MCIRLRSMIWRLINLRADDTEDECTPWQIAAVVLRIRSSTSHIVACAVAKTRRAVTVPRTSNTTSWARQDRNRDERANEEDVQKNPDPAKRAAAGVRALLDAAE
jgi:hypothetical protein